MLQRQAPSHHHPNIFNIFKPHNTVNPFENQQSNHAVQEQGSKRQGRILGGKRPDPIQNWQVKKNQSQLISEQSMPIGVEVSRSVQESQKISQVLSINEFGSDEQPMFLYNMHSQQHRNYDRFAFSELKIAVSELHRAFLELTDFVYEQRQLWLLMQKQHSAQLIQFANRFVRSIITQQSLKGTQRQSQCGKCRSIEAESAKRARAYQQQIQRLSSDNEELQEYIFDLQQKVVGIDLQVERKLQERAKISLNVDEQATNMVASLQKQIKQMKNQYESTETKEKQLKEREGKIAEAERSITRRENIIKDTMKKIQELKQTNFQREREILAAEQDLSKKISQLSTKQHQLNQWQAEITHKLKNTRDRYQFPSNSPSFQNSEDLNQSGISLKSFGRTKAVLDEHVQISSDNLINNSIQDYYVKKQYQQERGGRSHEKSKERQEYPIRNSRESGYNVKKHVHQHSNFRESQASPYKSDLNRRYANLQQSRNSPINYRDSSKNSKKSQSRVKPIALTSSSRIQRNPQLGGLGSKLQRLRQQIKKEIDSIK